MKKLLLFAALLTAFSFVGFAQKADKFLKGDHWYATGNLLDGKKIMLSKTKPAVSDWDAVFANNGVLKYCSVTKYAQVNAEGKEIAKGTYYCDPSYTYVMSGSVLEIKYPLIEWYYTVTKLPNGDLELTPATAEEFKNSSAK